MHAIIPGLPANVMHARCPRLCADGKWKPTFAARVLADICDTNAWTRHSAYVSCLKSSPSCRASPPLPLIRAPAPLLAGFAGNVQTTVQQGYVGKGKEFIGWYDTQFINGIKPALKSVADIFGNEVPQMKDLGEHWLGMHGW
jgi:hypothetical protein